MAVYILSSFQVAVIMAVNVSSSPIGYHDCNVALQCVQTAEGKIYCMKVSSVGRTSSLFSLN